MSKKDWKSKRLLKRRGRYASREVSQRPFIAVECPVCGNEYISRKSMLSHKRSHRG